MLRLTPADYGTWTDVVLLLRKQGQHCNRKAKAVVGNDPGLARMFRKRGEMYAYIARKLQVAIVRAVQHERKENMLSVLSSFPPHITWSSDSEPANWDTHA